MVACYPLIAQPLVALQPFSEGLDIPADLVIRLQYQPANVCPETRPPRCFWMYSIVAYLSCMTIDRASLVRRR